MKDCSFYQLSIIEFVLYYFIFYYDSNANIELADTLNDKAYEWLKEYIAIDTVNPPGNEINAVNFYKKIFKKNILLACDLSSNKQKSKESPVEITK